MDDKYTGCNIVESVVTTAPPRQASKKTRKKAGGRSHLLLRIIISALVIGVILLLHYFPALPFVSGLTGVLKKVLCYDIFGRTSFGVMLFG